LLQKVESSRLKLNWIIFFCGDAELLFELLLNFSRFFLFFG